MGREADGGPEGSAVAVIIAAKDEELRVGPTVEAARSLTGVDLVLVVDDGSTDRTEALAREAGARVVRLARGGVRRATGWEPEQPLNGQRCLSRAAFETARPLARGFGVETGLTIDVLRAGLCVVEVEVPLEHRATGADLRAQLHRAHQFTDVARALAVRGVGPAARRALARTGLRRRARSAY